MNSSYLSSSNHFVSRSAEAQPNFKQCCCSSGADCAHHEHLEDWNAPLQAVPSREEPEKDAENQLELGDMCDECSVLFAERKDRNEYGNR